ncbi:S-layer homology domain-containing protein [Paenibacillus rigui]|uniref:Uncharacterized protein n=1 Tax=Paenibacillus rigui TaxID=554312 RepID=A0A229UR95_9BACL|nr:S-layer homology domain-containing protein [Paenibacillus rigui]OXM85771.1 hypothetical protein CF651_13805 [Paenibacillus rigui]
MTLEHAGHRWSVTWIRRIVIFMIFASVLAAPVQAAEQWSQYAKIGLGSNEDLGTFSSPAGVAIDKWGNMYVADNVNHRIQKLTVATGVWSEWKKKGGGYGSGLGEFSNPSGVAVDSNDNVYVADSSNHRIQKLDSSTSVWSEWKKIDGGSGNGLGEFNDPKGVAVDNSGNVYVADSHNHRIQKLTVSSGVWSEWKKNGGGSGNGLGEFNDPKGVAVDESGNLYVADSRNHRIQKLTASTGTWSEWKKSGGGLGNGLGEFDQPFGVSLDRNRNLYVTDYNNHRIQKLDLSTGVWSEWKKSGGGSGSGLGEFYYPKGVTVDVNGNVYVVDSQNHRIQRLSTAEGQWSEWGYRGAVKGEGLGEFAYPNAVAVDKYKNVYVADFGNHRIQKREAATGVWTEWKKNGGGYGSAPGEFDGPADVAVDEDGNVYVADFYNHRIQKLDASTGVWSEWKKSGGGSGNGPGEFNYPSGVAVDHNKNVYVADYGNDRIQKLEVATGIWSEWKKNGGGAGSALGEFNKPSGIEVGNDGNVYVADMSNHRIQKLDSATGVWSEWKKNGGGSGSGLGEFNEPYSVAVDNRGNVYVADSMNNRIQKWNAAKNAWSEWTKSGGGSGSGLGEFREPLGVAVNDDYLYVAETSNHRIQILKMTITPPGTPTAVKAEVRKGESQATISFTLPDNDGGSDITGYTVTSSPEGLTASGTGSPITVTGLTYGTAYTFTVVATNRAGNSVASASSNSVTPTQLNDPVTVPGTPTAVMAEVRKGESQATIRFTPPDNDGGSAITGYTVTSSPEGLTASGTGSPITVTGLTYGTAYTFTVVATNRAGSSMASNASNAVIPVYFSSHPSKSGSSTSSKSDLTDAVILVNGKSEIAGTVKVANINSRSVITIAVDRKKLENQLAMEGQHAVVTIPVKDKSDVVIGELNGRMIKNMEEKQAVLEITTDRASYTLPAQQINIGAISDQVGKSIALEDIKVQIEIAIPTADIQKVVENMAAQGAFTLVAPPINFSVRAMNGDKSIEVSKFNVYVERTLAIPGDVDPNKITTGVVVDPDGSSTHVPTKVVAMHGSYYAVIKSLTNSTYSLVWHPIEFNDVANHWAKHAVNDMGSRMVIDGTGDGMFSPDREITRAEFAAILVRGLGLRLEKGSVPFSDVSNSDWYSNAVKTAYAYNLISGFEDGTFHPSDKITREQAMAMIAKAMKTTGLGSELPTPASQAVLTSFHDANRVAEWAKDSMIECLNVGIISGRNSTEVAPQSYITRAEVAAMMERLLQKSGLI